MPAFRYIKNIWAVLRQQANNDVWNVSDTGLPTAATGAGMLGPGSTYVDLATGIVYSNIGTKAAPIWVNLSTAVIVNGGLGGVANAKMTYDFAVDGGAISTITPTNSPILPINAIITNGFIDVTTLLTSGGAATVGLGLGSGAQVAALFAPITVAGAPWSTTGVKAIIPISAPTAVKVVAAARLTLTIAAFAVTAGKFDVNVQYQIGN